MHSPGHPEELSLLLLALLLLSIDWMARLAPDRARRMVAAAATGGLVAGLVLMKINVGVFAGQCLLLLLVRLTAPGAWTRGLAALLGLLMLVTPAALAIQLIDEPWVQLYVGFATLTMAATLTVFFRLKLPVMVTRADWIAVTAGGLGVAAIVIGATLLAGSSAFAVLDAVVLQNTRFVRNWFLVTDITVEGQVGAALSLGLALACAIGSGRDQAFADNAPLRCLILIAKAAFVATALYHFTSPEKLFPLLAPFCWLVMVAPSGSAPPVIVLRAATGLIGAMLTFYAFPVAGHQVEIAMLVGVLAVPVVGHDILVWARTGRKPRPRLRLAGVVVASALLLLLGSVQTKRAGQTYLARVPLGLPGTALIRLPPKQVAALRQVTSDLQQGRSSYSLPGLLSFAFWTGHPLVSTWNINHVLGFIQADRQQAIVAALRHSPDLCIVYSDELMRMLDRGQVARDPPLVHYLRSEFAVVAVHGRYAILKRSETPPGLPADWIIGRQATKPAKAD